MPAQELLPRGPPIALRRRLQTARLENVRDRAPCDLVAQIVQRPLYPPVAPIPILRCHTDDRLFYRIPGSRPARTTVFTAIVFPGDQLPVPGQQGLRRDDRRDFPEDATPEHPGLGSQAPTLIVVQTEAFGSQLLAQYPVFFAEIVDRVALLLAQPTGYGNHEQSKRVEAPAHWHRIATKTAATDSATRTTESRSLPPHLPLPPKDDLLKAA